MKKIISILVIAGLMFGGMVMKAHADGVSDTFTITVTVSSTLNIMCKQLDGVTDYGNWAITPAIALSGNSTMTSAQGVCITNTSSVKIDLKGGASGASVWGIGSAAVAADDYVLRLKGQAAAGDPGDLSAATPVITATTFDNNGAAGIDIATARYVYARFEAPSSSTTGLEQTITVTITASVH